jgi:uncharacterized metal-binding protein
MPSGKAHDAITVILAAPTFSVAWGLTNSLPLALLGTGAMLLGGLMFGPDLDTNSRQYTRWGIFRIIWLPYRFSFRHRSRWSHGVIFGTLIRVLYFSGAVAFLISAAVFLRAAMTGGASVGLTDVVRTWQTVETVMRHTLGRHALLVGFLGLWWGAASHTLADVAWSMMRKAVEIF